MSGGILQSVLNIKIKGSQSKMCMNGWIFLKYEAQANMNYNLFVVQKYGAVH
jgi:hypothetical protein